MSPWLIVALHRFASGIATFLAVFGAIILLNAAAIVTYSVILRVLIAGQVRGDFEIMAVSSGIAIVLFLPYCQASRSHVLIEVFTAWLPEAGRRLLDAIWLLVLAVAAALLTWRLLVGLEEAWSRHEVTMMLNLPLYVVFAAAAVGVAGTTILAVLDFLRAFGISVSRDGEWQ